MSSLAKKEEIKEYSSQPLQKWKHIFEDELNKVDKVLLSLAKSEAELIPQLVEHIVKSGGKRLRPILVILASKLCGYNEGDRHVNLAACIEFLHTATLLHDDVVDDSDLRRGKKTANNLWGNAPSILVGDFLLSRSFQLMARDGSLEVLRVLSDTSAIITEGEVKQLIAISDIDLNEEDYIEIISAKTAQLFAAACQIGAIIAGKNKAEEDLLSSFGSNLGIAFQIVDDALDYSAKQEELGKEIGDDFREGKVTLPVILSYLQSDEKGKAFWKEVIEKEEKSEDDLKEAIKLMSEQKILDQVFDRARIYADKAAGALMEFNGGEEKQAMLDLLEFSIDRPY